MQYYKKKMTENDSSSATRLKVTEDWDLTDREFKIDVMKKFSELYEKSERQFNELKNKINELKEYFTKKMDIFKKRTKLWS